MLLYSLRSCSTPDISALDPQSRGSGVAYTHHMLSVGAVGPGEEVEVILRWCSTLAIDGHCGTRGSLRRSGMSTVASPVLDSDVPIYAATSNGPICMSAARWLACLVELCRAKPKAPPPVSLPLAQG